MVDIVRVSDVKGKMKYKDSYGKKIKVEFYSDNKGQVNVAFFYGSDLKMRNFESVDSFMRYMYSVISDWELV